jgi:hypothetical protein
LANGASRTTLIVTVKKPVFVVISLVVAFTGVVPFIEHLFGLGLGFSRWGFWLRTSLKECH